MKYVFLLFVLFFISCSSEEEVTTPQIYEGEITTSALKGYNLIDDAIKEIDADSKLFQISTENINIAGESSKWSYSFMNQTGDTLYTINLEFGSDYISIRSDTLLYNMVGASIITKSWIDSDMILNIAEKNGGKEFRNNNSDYIISISLSEAVVPNSYPVWNVNYNAVNKLLIRINAVTGKVE